MNTITEMQTNNSYVPGDSKIGDALVPLPTEAPGAYVMVWASRSRFCCNVLSVATDDVVPCSLPLQDLDGDGNGGVYTVLMKGRDTPFVSYWLRVQPCPSSGCWPPPPLVDSSGKELFTRGWSNASTWVNTTSDYANPLNVINPDDPTELLQEQVWLNALPSEGDSVWIPRRMTVVLDVSPPPLKRLIIAGELRFSDEVNNARAS